MTLVLSLVAAATRLGANWAVGHHHWWGWPLKLPSMVIFTLFNVWFGLVGMHLLTAADLWLTLTTMLRWKRRAAALRALEKVYPDTMGVQW